MVNPPSQSISSLEYSLNGASFVLGKVYVYVGCINVCGGLMCLVNNIIMKNSEMQTLSAI